MANTDAFKNFGSIDGPANHAVAVVPSDTTDLPLPPGGSGNVSRGLYVGVAGDVTVIMAGGQTVLFKAVPAGTLLPIRVSRVMQTGTTATTMVALQ